MKTIGKLATFFSFSFRFSCEHAIGDFYFSMCKVLEARVQQDEERMEQLTVQLKESRLLAEDADGKSDEVSRKLAFVEDELEAAEERVKSGHSKVQELDEELQVFSCFFFFFNYLLNWGV